MSTENIAKIVKEKYGQDSDVPYKILNKLKFMKGNKETPKGAAAQKKHEKKEESSSKGSKVDAGTKAKMISKME